MTDKQIQLIQYSWQQIAPKTEEIAQSFYEELFEAHPCLRALFPRNFQIQVTKLSDMLEYIIISLDRLDVLLPQVQLLGIRHARYNVELQHYDLVGEALLKALRMHLSALWTGALAHAWLATYTLIADIMKEAQSNFASSKE